MNDPPASNPPSDGCPTIETLRAFVLGQLTQGGALNVAAHLYMKGCPRCGQVLLAMPETTASALTPPPVGSVHERPTDEASPGTAPTGDPPLSTTGPRPLRLGRYAIRHQVGKGGFGTVYAAYDDELGRWVAIKVPYAYRLNSSEQQQTTAEARLHASLDHPNIVPIYDVGRTDEIPCYFVSKLIAGQDLATRIQKGRPGSREAAELLLFITGALAHLHDRGLVHRDVKPRNILLDEAGIPYLADFGLAMQPLPADATVVEEHLIAGTLPYMSPEQARGDSQRVDQRTDLYAMGVVLYEMLTGTKPFRGGVASVRQKILNEAPIPPRSLDAGVPRDLEAICLKAMAKDAGQRYQDAGQLAEDLRRYLAHEPLIHARHVAPWERALSWVRRHRALSAAASVAAVAVVVASVLAMWKPEERVPVVPPAEKTVRVTVQTDPAGAGVSFFPLDETTGIPLPARVVKGQAGEEVNLVPGHFLVVAVLAGKPGEAARFHEVFRLVPGGKAGGMSGPFRHNRWKLIDDVLHLETIVLPPVDVANGMCLFPEGKGVWMDQPEPTFDDKGKATFPRHRIDVPAFFLDTTEVAVKEYHPWLKGVQNAAKEPADHPTHAASGVTWNHAVAYAEWRGKRLPDELEYTYAATACGKSRFPWGDSPDPLKGKKWSFGPVGTPEYDEVVPPGQRLAVYGLYSNVAEWTSSWLGENPARDPTLPASAFRVVKGGPDSAAEGKQELYEIPRGPGERFGMTHPRDKPGVGFRCARSPRPRLAASDFPGVAGR